MTVSDADGKRLGKVTRCDPWGFQVQRGFFSPYEWVIRYDEVVEISGDAVKVARADDALLELAAGQIPHSWKRVRSPGAAGSLPATPAEGRAADGFLPERTPDADEP